MRKKSELLSKHEAIFQVKQAIQGIVDGLEECCHDPSNYDITTHLDELRKALTLAELLETAALLDEALEEQA